MPLQSAGWTTTGHIEIRSICRIVYNLGWMWLMVMNDPAVPRQQYAEENVE
jgi:hypothetical protein